MSTEDRIREALHAVDSYEPSADLFSKVQRSISEDRAHRSRLLRLAAAATVWLVVLLGWFGITASVVDDSLSIPWWSLEVGADYVMMSFVVLMGPLIRRFGQGYAEAVFAANRATGRRFLRLVDIAYYLVLVAYVVIAAQLQPVDGSLGELVNLFVPKVAGLFLLTGILHSVTIVLLPFVGLVFSSNWRAARRGALGSEAPPPDPAAERADRVVRTVLWLLIGIAGLLAAMLVLLMAVGIVAGGLES